MHSQMLCDSNKAFISYEEFISFQHQENLALLLGNNGTKNRVGCQNFRTSNVETKTFEYVYQNLEVVLSTAIRETELFPLRPEQRLAIGEAMTRYPFELFTKFCGSNGGIVSMARYPNMQPLTRLLNYSTGSGKTVIAISRAMAELCESDLWKTLKADWKRTVWSSQGIDYSGLGKKTTIEEETLVRVCLAIVPKPLLHQWEQTALAIRDSFRQEKQCEFLIWTGTATLRGNTNVPSKFKMVEKTLKNAHVLTEHCKQAMLWIVPADTVSQ
jgi:hypothetical protein